MSLENRFWRGCVMLVANALILFGGIGIGNLNGDGVSRPLYANLTLLLIGFFFSIFAMLWEE